jgi:hypothetical protein
MSRVVAFVLAGTVAGTLLSHPLAATLLAGPHPTPLAAALADQVVVRTYDTAGVAPREVAAALETAHAILSGVAIDLVWRECGRCDETPGPRELIVRIAAAPARAEPMTLGYSLVDVEERSGSLATIFADRVESIASAAQFDPGVLLGRSIAHELGHLLMGTTEHSAHGLMRARWDPREVERNLQRDWVLSPGEGTRMRRGLEARARRSRVPAMVIAADGEVALLPAGPSTR